MTVEDIDTIGSDSGDFSYGSHFELKIDSLNTGLFCWYCLLKMVAVSDEAEVLYNVNSRYIYNLIKL
jgi:hypothetical protein